MCWSVWRWRRGLYAWGGNLDITWTVELTPIVGVLIVAAVALTVYFLVQQNFDAAAVVVSVLSLGLFLPFAPLIFLGDTVFFAIRGNRPFTIGCGVLTVIAFVVFFVVP